MAGKIPHDFKLAAVDERLMSSDGSRIRILGVASIENNYVVIECVNTIIRYIGKIILHNASAAKLTIEEIAKECRLLPLDVSIYLDLAQYYIRLYTSSTYKGSSTILESIDVSGNDEVFYNYLHFKGIQQYLGKTSQKTDQNINDYFSKSEITALNEKLDWLMEEMKKVTLSQEFTYNDVIEELNDLRNLFGLKKKDWKRLLVAKLADMTGSGLVGSIIAEPIAKDIKPVLDKLLE